jgi:diguanylate cyclase (GGDEF)-like protein
LKWSRSIRARQRSEPERRARAISRGSSSSSARRFVRFGGEEFLLVLPETDLDGAQTVAEKVRRAVQEIRLGLDAGEEASVTVSIGLASLDEVLDEDLRVATPRDLIAAADRALYRAKGAGRNRVHPLLHRAG